MPQQAGLASMTCFFNLMPVFFAAARAWHFRGTPMAVLSLKTLTDLGIVLTAALSVGGSLWAEPLTAGRLRLVFRATALSKDDPDCTVQEFEQHLQKRP